MPKASTKKSAGGGPGTGTAGAVKSTMGSVFGSRVASKRTVKSGRSGRR